VTGENDSTLTFYRVKTFPTSFPDGEAAESERPDICYRYSDPVGGKFGTPTFSPDGSRAAFAVGDGVHVVTVPDLSAGCTTTGASPTTQLLIAGATQPDWGPADAPSSRPGGSGGGGTPGGGGAGAGDGGSPGTPATATVTVKRARLRSALKRGLAVKLTGAKAGRTKITAKYRGRVVASATGTAKADGTLSARLKFTRAANRSMRRLSSARIVVSAGGAKSTVTLRR